MKSDFRYSKDIVYNNFPWPNARDGARDRVIEAAKLVLSEREKHLPPKGVSTLADLYDPIGMPPGLVDAHAALDKMVDRCYRTQTFRSDRERVEFLFWLTRSCRPRLLLPRSFQAVDGRQHDLAGRILLPISSGGAFARIK